MNGSVNSSMKSPGNSNWKMAIEELVAATEGKLLSQVQREFSGVGTDTRKDLTGKIFVALKGDTFDAHDYIDQAVAAGASAIVLHRVSESVKLNFDKTTVLQVEDTLKALQNLGNYWRRKMPAKVLGLTGSNGKTTTKEFAATLISSCKSVYFSKGSLNNHWGVPMSLLELGRHHEIAIIEMGMNHLGELTVLSGIAEPDVICVTMVGRGHLEGLGSIEGVARAKEEVYEFAKPHALHIFNIENSYTRKMFEKYAPRLSPDQTITFAGGEYARDHHLLFGQSLEAPAQTRVNLDVSLEILTMDLNKMLIRGEVRGLKGEIEIPIFGMQNITNLMAAAALALAAGLTPAQIWKALPKCHTTWGRNQWVKLESGAMVLFDGYNANPESMKAALDNFKKLKTNGKKYAVLGEMKEMGAHAIALHRELGELAGQVGFSTLAFLGPSHEAFSAGIKTSNFSKNLFVSNSYEQKLAPNMLPVLEMGDIVLMKGSRGMQLEKVLLDMKPLDFELKK